MVSATADQPEPQPQDNDEVPALAGVLMRTLKIPAAQAVEVARVLVDNGVHVNVGEQTMENWWSQIVAYYEVNPPERVTLKDIEEAAAVERSERLSRLVGQSRGQLIPSAYLHHQINHILDEMGV